MANTDKLRLLAPVNIWVLCLYKQNERKCGGVCRAQNIAGNPNCAPAEAT